MADELRDIKDRAARELARGNTDRAFEAFAHLCKAEPKEGQWPLRAADALRKLERKEDAIAYYERAARTFNERGFLLRAIAVAKLVSELSGSDGLLRELEQGRRSSATPLSPAVRQPALPVDSPQPDDSGHPLPPPLGSRLAVPPLAAVDRVSIIRPSMASSGPAEPYEEIEIAFLDADDGVLLVEDDGVDAKPASSIPSQRQLPAIPLFAELPEGAFLELASRMTVRSFGAGQTVAAIGEPPTSIFVIIDGFAKVTTLPGDVLQELGPGDFFGEMSLLLDEPRRASVVASSDLDVFEMNRALVDELLRHYPEVATVLARLVKARLVTLLLATAPIFAPFDGASRRDLVRRFELRGVAGGTHLITEGIPGDGLYVVVSGAFEVRRGATDVLAQLGPGEVFGEMSLLSRGEAVATVEAARPSLVLRLARTAFQETIFLYPPVLEHIAALAEARVTAPARASDATLVLA